MSKEIQMPGLALRIKELREERNLTQRSMAAFLGKTDRHYQAIEAGEVNIPSLTLIKLADFFEVSLDYLVGRSEERSVSHGKQS